MDNIYKTFEDLKFKDIDDGVRKGVVCRIEFDNGYGASVVSHSFSYGGDRGLYEIAVLKDGDLHYDNEVANGDVLGYLTVEDVSDTLIKIQQL